MGDVVDLAPRRRDPQEPLVDRLRRALREEGWAQVGNEELDELGVDVAGWRCEARQAARSLNRPVQTSAGPSGAWAMLRDWPATPAEEMRHRVRLRRVVEAAAEGHDLNPQDPPRPHR